MQKTSKTLTFSPRDVCKWFHLSRTTLFRWERDGVISRPTRDWTRERSYTAENIMEIADMVRVRVGTQLGNSPAGPDRSLFEALSLADLARDTSTDVAALKGLDHLFGLASTGPLSPQVIDRLVEYALSLPANDERRRAVWQILTASDLHPTL